MAETPAEEWQVRLRERDAPVILVHLVQGANAFNEVMLALAIHRGDTLDAWNGSAWAARCRSITHALVKQVAMLDVEMPQQIRRQTVLSIEVENLMRLCKAVDEQCQEQGNWADEAMELTGVHLS